MARVLPVIVALLSVSGTAAAQEAAADALFESARVAMAKGDFAHACERFRASDKLDPAPGTELNLADCEEKRGRLASAWVLFRMLEDKLSPSDERFAVAHGRVEALRNRVPKLTLGLAANAPPGVTVRDGDVELGAAAFGISLPVDPGPHRLVVSAPGFTSRTFELLLAEGEVRTLEVAPGAVAPARQRPLETSSKQELAPASGASGRRTLGFVLGGVGIAGLATGAVAGVLMLGKKSTVDDGCRPDKSCTSAGLDAAHSGRTFQIVSNVGWVVGAAALGAGAYFLLTSGPSSKPSTVVALAPNPSGAQLSLSRNW